MLADEEIKILWKVLAGESPQVAAAVKVLLLLGQRSTETLEMRWSDLALEADVPIWTIAGRFRKGHRSHVVPLSPLAARILARLWPITRHKAWASHVEALACEQERPAEGAPPSRADAGRASS